MNHHHQHAVEEILANIKSHDLIKARIVMGQFGQLATSDQRRILYEVNRSNDALGLPLLVTILVSDKQSRITYSSLEETVLVKAMARPQVVLSELLRTGAEQFYYARLCSILGLEEARESLEQLLQSAKDHKLLKEAMQALGTLASPLSVNAISEFLHAPESELVYQAIDSLGQIASPTAMKRLSERLGQDESIDMLILDIFARIQDEVSLHKLNDTMRSSSSYLRNYSKQKLLEIGVKALPILAENLEKRDIDLQIHSLNLISEIGDESSVLPVRRLLQSHPTDANVRFAAYEAMTVLPNLRGDYVLAAGLVDDDDNVRMAAARAIDIHFDEVLASGIKNMVGRQDGIATRIIKAVVDSQTKQIFLGLLDIEFFWNIASAYLAAKAHVDIRDFYVTLLMDHNPELAEQIRAATPPASPDQKATICAVDDSQMILSIYRTILTELDYEPILFANPEEALGWLRVNKPLLLCTDLNMPELNGIELSRLTREIYSKEELPIIMITTQNDGRDKSQATEVGINTMLHKPFNSSQLASAINEVVI